MNGLLLGCLVLLAWLGTDVDRLAGMTADDTFASLQPPRSALRLPASDDAPAASGPADSPTTASLQPPQSVLPFRLPSFSGGSRSAPAPLPTGLPTAARLLVYSMPVKRGDTLSRLFERYGVRVRQAYSIADLPEAKVLKNISPGKALTVSVDTVGRLHSLSYPLTIDRNLVIRRLPDDGGFVGEENVRSTTRVEYLAEGTIHSTLYQAGRKAGLSRGMLKQMQQVFGGQVDFNRDVQPGDTFRVFYDAHEIDGHHLRDGHLLAAEVVLQGDKLQAFRYVRESGEPGYYDADGRSVETAFQRSPLPLARVSSAYSARRFHPILKVWRKHQGVDYAAPTGTPVAATGHGRVHYVGWQRGYGKVVILRHADGYSTLYGHLSKFSKGLKRGQRVRRGETIAYVGSTGWSTGPHLHYEFRENGRHKDPQSISLPPGKPVPDTERPNFTAAVTNYLASLDPDTPQALALRDATE